VALVGGRRLPQVLEQVRIIRSNSGGQRTPMVMCIDGNNQEAMLLAGLLNITIATNENIPYEKG